MSKPLKILWMSNSPWVGTGYGIQARHVIPYLKERPEVEDVGLFNYYGLQGNFTRLQVGKHWIDCYPMGTDPHGNDMVNDWMEDFGANVLITLLDVFITKPQFGAEGWRWLPYAPVDHDPLPQIFKDRFANAYMPIVYSKFGQKMCKDAGIETWYAPHGVETKIFKPRSADYRRRCRDWLGLKEDSFVVGVVAANKDPQDRKGFSEIFESFRALLDVYPNCELYVHSLFTPEFGGWDLMSMANLYGIADNTRFTTRRTFFKGLSREELADVYQGFDVFLNPCKRAGFEIPLIESQASGIPIIAGDWHSMTELCGSGWLIEPERRLFSPVGGWMFSPKLESINENLLAAYESKGDPKIARNARDFAMEYDWERVTRNHWGSIIDRLAEEITVRKIDPIPAEQIRIALNPEPVEVVDAV